MGRLAVGQVIAPLVLDAVEGASVRVPDPERMVHLYFSRFADCPICNLHIGRLRQRTPEMLAAGLRTVGLFHSPADQVRTYRADLPFPCVADPDRRWYGRFGVETSRRALLHPQAAARLIAEARAGHTAQEAHGGIHGLPADFLIGPDGVVRLAHYGRHADDSASVDALLAAASAADPPAHAEL